jgi:4-hydroxybenzoate polyprenyltransferase
MATSSSYDRDQWWAAVAYDPLPIGGIAVALMLGTGALLPFSPSLPLLVAGFCGTALVYAADRTVVPSPEDAVNHPGRRRWVRAHRTWLMGETGLLLVVGGGALAYLRPTTLLAAGGLGVLVGLHLLPIGRWGRPLKSVGVGKPLVVAGAWALGATLLPALEADYGPNAGVWALAGYRMLFLLPNVLLADWGDRRGDGAVGHDAWTANWSGRGLRWVATGLLGLAVAGALVASRMAPVPLLLWIDAAGPLLLLGAVWTLTPNRPGARLVMDGLIAWPLLTALAAWGLG